MITLDDVRPLIGKRVTVTYRVGQPARTETEIGKLLRLGGATGTALVLNAAPMSLPGFRQCPAESIIGLDKIDSIKLARR